MVCISQHTVKGNRDELDLLGDIRKLSVDNPPSWHVGVVPPHFFRLIFIQLSAVTFAVQDFYVCLPSCWSQLLKFARLATCSCRAIAIDLIESSSGMVFRGFTCSQRQFSKVCPRPVCVCVCSRVIIEVSLAFPTWKSLLLLWMHSLAERLFSWE